jgi:hypothetical protein
LFLYQAGVIASTELGSSLFQDPNFIEPVRTGSLHYFGGMTMLEILLLIFLTRKIGAICEEKGRKAGGYKALTVVLWFGGEIAGAIIGVVATSGDGGALVYLLALFGAAVGAAISFAIVNSLTPIGPPAEHMSSVVPRS